MQTMVKLCIKILIPTALEHTIKYTVFHTFDWLQSGWPFYVFGTKNLSPNVFRWHDLFSLTLFLFKRMLHYALYIMKWHYPDLYSSISWCCFLLGSCGDAKMPDARSGELTRVEVRDVLHDLVKSTNVIAFNSQRGLVRVELHLGEEGEIPDVVIGLLATKSH